MHITYVMVRRDVDGVVKFIDSFWIKLASKKLVFSKNDFIIINFKP